MAVRLNKPAFEHAKHLLTEGKFVADQRGSWSEHQPSAAGGNEFIRLHDYEEFGKWLLGIDDEKSTRTKAGRLVLGNVAHVVALDQNGQASGPTADPMAERSCRIDTGMTRRK
jgi:hypothetical protein